MTPSRAVLALLGLTLVRLLVAALVPLSPDEAYYWVWSLAPAAGYLDHPPMVALWIRAGTALASETAFGVRLLAPIAALVGSLLLARAARDLLGLAGGRAWHAPLLLNATLLLGAGAVTMTPDTPLLLFWTATLACAGRWHATGRAWWLVGLGAALGLGFDSKYTAILLAPAIVVWLLRSDGRFRIGPVVGNAAAWGGLVAACLTVAPVIRWNANHGYASLLKQGGRIDHGGSSHAARYLSELVGGQVGLATPLVFVLFVAGVGAVWRRMSDRTASPRTRNAALLVLLATLIPTAVFAWHATGARVQANWPGVVYPSAAMGAACLSGGTVPRVLRLAPALALGLAVTFLVYLQAATGWLALPRTLDPTIARLAGWRSLASEVSAFRAPGDEAVVADEYGLAAELAWNRVPSPVVAVEPRWALFDLPHPPLDGREILLVRSLRHREPPDPTVWTRIRFVGVASRGRGGVVAERYGIWRAVGLHLVDALLPSRPP